MKTKTAILVALVTLVSLQAQAELGISFSFGSHYSGSSVGTSVFYSSGHIHNQLAPYGSWFRLEPYGMVWQPREAFGVPEWHPYGEHGSWATVNGSRCWNSRYAWGGTPYRNGRWYHCSKRGWLWIPGALYVTPAPRRIVSACRPPAVVHHRRTAVNYHRPPAVSYHRPSYSRHSRPPVTVNRHRGSSRHQSGPRRMGHGELRSGSSRHSSRTVQRPSHRTTTRSSSSSSSRANQFHMQMRNRR